jgi:hypothetical protein
MSAKQFRNARRHRMKVRRGIISAMSAMLLFLGLSVVASPPASALNITWTRHPGNVTFDKPVVRMGYDSATYDNLQLVATTVSGSASAGYQYAVIHLHGFYSCSTGWCNAGAKNWTSPWIYGTQRVNVGNIQLSVLDGRYYTYIAQTTWYDTNGYVVGQETYYPTASGTAWFQNGQWYDGNGDFACVAYAYNQGKCRPYGLAAASASPTGSLYTLYAGKF